MLDNTIAITAARNFRSLRARGIAVRKTVDLIIGTWCIAHDIALLRDDRDFEPVQRYLGLKIICMDTAEHALLQPASQR